MSSRMNLMNFFSDRSYSSDEELLNRWNLRNYVSGMKKNKNHYEFHVKNINVILRDKHVTVPCLVASLTSEERKFNCAIVHLHGAGYDLYKSDEILELCEAFHGVPVYAVEYPGFGYSTINVTEPFIDAAAAACLDLCREDNPDTPIIVSGMSMGCGPAIKLVADRAGTPTNKIIGLMTFAGWAQLKDCANIIGSLNAGAILPNYWDSLSLAIKIPCQWLIIHGRRDALIPIANAEKLHKNADGTLCRLEIIDADHTYDSEFFEKAMEPLRNWTKYMLATIPSLQLPHDFRQKISKNFDFEHKRSLVYVPGFNNTENSVYDQAYKIVLADRNVQGQQYHNKYHIAAWTSSAGVVQRILRSSLPPGSALVSAAASYVHDKYKTEIGDGVSGELVIGMPAVGTPFDLVCHSRGTVAFSRWLASSYRQADINVIAMVHPDICRSQIRSILSDEIRGKIVVFDATNDYATSISGVFGILYSMITFAGFDGSKDVGPLCRARLRISSYSHSIWISDGEILSKYVMSWLSKGQNWLSALRVPNNDGIEVIDYRPAKK